MKNKKNIILIVGFVLVALISFYAGSSFSSPKKNTNTQNNFGQFGQGAQMGQGQKGARTGGGNVFGKIIAKDANSITVELGSFGPNGTTSKDAQNTTQTGSKIVFYTDQTTVTKTTNGIIGDLVVGKNISVSGSANPDGSVNAQTVQIR